MNESLFIEFVKAIWPKLSLFVKETVNNSRKPLTYLHKELLRPVYSPDQKWEGTSANTNYVSADMVAMDSPLPLKKRDSLGVSSGTLPKVGLRRILQETDINNLNIMKSHYATATVDALKAAQMNQILNRITNDGVFCSVGIDELNEANFLKALSDGVIAVDDEKNTGTALRVDYGYPKSNQFATEVKGHINEDDITRVKDYADSKGCTITKIMMSLSTFNQMRKETWAKMLVANSRGITLPSDPSKLAVPTRTSFIEAFKGEYDIDIVTIDRSIQYEKGGKKASYKPWNNDKVVFLTDRPYLGSLVYGTLAEMTNPVQGVQYSTVEQYKLIARYSKNDPSLQEVTSGQALVLPVIEDVDQIFVLDISTAEEVNATEEAKDTTDAKVTIAGVTYIKASLITLMKKQGISVAANASDETIIKKINNLSSEEKTAFIAAAESCKDNG